MGTVAIFRAEGVALETGQASAGWLVPSLPAGRLGGGEGTIEPQLALRNRN